MTFSKSPLFARPMIGRASNWRLRRAAAVTTVAATTSAFARDAVRPIP
jgi:hypothetical protein